MKTNELKSKLNNVEIEGLISMFNQFMDIYEDRHESHPAKYGFFYCSDSVCSEDEANGHPIEFEGLPVHYLGMLENGLTYIICQDSEEKEHIFEFNCYSGDFYNVTD